MTTTHARRLVAVAALAVAALGAAPAAADPLCESTSAVKGFTVEVCGPGFVCGTDTPCTWHNPDVTCTHQGGPGAPACDAIDRF